MIFNLLAAVAAAAAKVAGAIPQLTALSDPLSSSILDPTSDLPQVSVRFNTDGTIQEAIGDSGSALSYSTVGNWLDNVPPDDSADWELNFTVNSETGAAGTWGGATTGSFIALSTQRTFTWQKDTSAIGTANSDVTATLRQVSRTSNSTSVANLTYVTEVSA